MSYEIPHLVIIVNDGPPALKRQLLLVESVQGIKVLHLHLARTRRYKRQPEIFPRRLPSSGGVDGRVEEASSDVFGAASAAVLWIRTGCEIDKKRRH